MGNVYRGGGVGDWKMVVELWMGMFDFIEIFFFICDFILNYKGYDGYRCEVFNERIFLLESRMYFKCFDIF